MSKQKLSISKPTVSISEICKMIQLSRARYYQLINSGFFPKPLHDKRSGRPYYDAKLQKAILEARQSGIGCDGSFMLFYSPRKSESVSHLRKKKTVDPQVKELTETLESMGLEVKLEQVQQGLVELYPDGTKNVEQGIIIRELFRYIKQKIES